MGKQNRKMSAIRKQMEAESDARIAAKAAGMVSAESRKAGELGSRVVPAVPKRVVPAIEKPAVVKAKSGLAAIKGRKALIDKASGY